MATRPWRSGAPLATFAGGPTPGTLAPVRYGKEPGGPAETVRRVDEARRGLALAAPGRGSIGTFSGRVGSCARLSAPFAAVAGSPAGQPAGSCARGRRREPSTEPPPG